MKKYIFLALLVFQLAVNAQTPEKPNILFVIFDDLNDWAEGWDGHPQASTPNISALAEQGTIFMNAYASAPECAPSRTSFLTGKDLAYTQVYANSYIKCVLANNFSAETNNEEYVSLPQYLKDSAGYFTYSANKVFHCYKYGTEYDSITEEPCLKELSWNKRIIVNDEEFTILAGDEFNDGIAPFRWGRLDSTLETQMDDYRTVDSVLAFWEEGDTVDNTCGNPWFIAVGIKKPHFPSFAPEQYFYNEYYMADPLADPYHIPYNFPEGSTPYNGIVIPAQTSPVRFADYDALPEDGVALLLNGNMDQIFTNYPGSLEAPPLISDTISDSLRNIILENSQRANLVMSYLATSSFADAQFGRLMAGLAAYPEMYSNTVVVVIGDHGFSLGEKKHWQKGTLWEQDIRSICMVADLRNPESHVSQHMVSFLDLFPTMCDLAGLPYPTFSDGSPYLDGKSMLPYMHSMPLKEERPVITAVRNRKVAEGSCYPHHSIRNERFHLIDYTPSSGIADNEDCMLLVGETERELYEIGRNREIDPNEFVNLAYDPAYQPVVDYLLQYKPDGEMYLRQGLKTDILAKGMACFLGSADSVRMLARVYDTTGVSMAPSDLSGYTIEWSNNATGVTATGMMSQLTMSDIPAAYFDANDKLYIYVKVINNTTGVVEGFEMKTIYINPDNVPSADYSVWTDDNRVHINDYSLTGSVKSVAWNFGDGTVVSDPIAAPHTYQTAGGFMLRHTLFYGNGCKVNYSDPVFIDSLSYRQPMARVTMYPNPASQTLSLVTDQYDKPWTYKIFDLTGKEYLRGEVSNGHTCHIDVSVLPNGTYLVQTQGEQLQGVEKLVILR